MAIDCKRGVTVEACDDEELLEHIAAAHEAAMRREPAAQIADAYEV